MLAANQFKDSGDTDLWLTAATGMDKNSAKSTGGYVSYTAG
jgi:hypothetical protein